MTEDVKRDTPEERAPQPLSREKRDGLRSVFDAEVPLKYQRLIDRRYPWRPQPRHSVDQGAIVVALVGALIIAFGYRHLAAIAVGAILMAIGFAISEGPNILLALNERRDKKNYDAYLGLMVPGVDLVDIADQHPDLGALIWRMQQAVGGVQESEALRQQLLTGVITLQMLTETQLGLLDQMNDLAAERALLSRADGRAALAEALRPRRAAAARWLSMITESVEELEAISAEVALLDDGLADLRIAEQIFGEESPVIRQISVAPVEIDGLQGAVAGIRAVRDFIGVAQPRTWPEEN